MNSIQQEIHIMGKPAEVYRALATQAGYRGFWNAVAEVPEKVGGEAKLRFVKEGMPIDMRFRIDEMKKDERVRWTCVAHAMPSWVGTTLTWTIEDADKGVRVALEHAGWKEPAPDAVAQGWQHFIGSLKAYVETGTGQPW